jgi:stress response protein SCP2
MTSAPKGKSKVLYKASDLKQPVSVGLSWDPKVRASLLEKLEEMAGGKTTFTDMDLAAYVYDRNKNFLGLASAKAEDITLFTPHIYHSGDNMDGKGSGDDEKIIVEFDELDESVSTIIFKMNIASGHVFSEIDMPEIRMAYQSSNQVILKNKLDSQSNKSAFIFAKIFRDINGDWHVQNIEEFTHANDDKTWSEELKIYLK